MKHLKLNSKGFAHHFLALLFVVVFAIAGIGYLVASHADTVAYTSTNEFSKFQYSVGSGTTAPLTHANSTNLLLQFNKGLTTYHPTDMAVYQLSLPANTTANSLTANVSYVDAGYDTVFVATGSPSHRVWSVSRASTQSNQAVNLSFSDKPTVIYFGISARGSSGGFNGTFPANRNLTVNSYTLKGVTTTASSAPTVSLSANPTSVAANGTSTLTWSSTNATSCTASGGWSGTKATSGSASTGALTATTAYSLSCTGSGGTGTANTSVSVATGGGGGGGGTTANCTTTINAGSSISSAMGSASPGAVICLNPGTYSAPSISKGGNASNYITVTSANTSNPAVIAGRTVVEDGANYLNINHLKFTWTSQQLDQVVVLSTSHVNFTHNDISGANGAICLVGNNYASGVFSYNLLDHNTIHDCRASGSGNPNETQGMYVEGGPGDVFTNNWCWNVSGRCWQIRGEDNSVWHNNVSDNSGQGFIFGGDAGAANNNNVYNNIVGSVVGNSVNGPYSALDFQTGNSSGNNFHDNCVSRSPAFQNTSSSGNTVVSVQFVDAANHNYNLTSAAVNAPCQAYAVQGGNPGP